jgi:hypothetical protein
MSSLDRAAARGNLRVTEILIQEAGADPCLMNQYGWTALHFAAVRGHIHVCKYLIDQKFSSNPVDPTAETTSGWTPLKLAAKARQHQAAQYFRELVIGEIEARKLAFLSAFIRDRQIDRIARSQKSLFDRKILHLIFEMIAKSPSNHGPLYPTSEFNRMYVRAQRNSASSQHLCCLVFTMSILVLLFLFTVLFALRTVSSYVLR